MLYKFLKVTTLGLTILTLGLSAFSSIVVESRNSTTKAANNEIILNLPFPVGKTYVMTSGAHSFSANCYLSGTTDSVACKSRGEGWSALDFSTSEEIGSVNAMASGTAYKRSNCEVGIQHSNGYITRYLHLANINIKDGQNVKVGDQIGSFYRNSLSCGVGSGGHVHVAIWKNINGTPVQQNIFDFRIGNYLPQDSNSRYTGCIIYIPNQKSMCPGNFSSNSSAWLINDGIISSPSVTTPTVAVQQNRNPKDWLTPKLIRRKGTNQCLNAYQPKNGSKLDTYVCNINDKDQIFTFEDIGSWQFLIKNQSGFCVNAYQPSNYKKINLWKCNRNDNDQRFRYEDMLFKSMNSGNQCINAYQTKNYMQINTYSCNKGDQDQIWELI